MFADRHILLDTCVQEYMNDMNPDITSVYLQWPHMRSHFPFQFQIRFAKEIQVSCSRMPCVFWRGWRGEDALTVETGEVSPLEQRAVEGRQGAVEGLQGAVEVDVSSIGRVSDGVCEQIHLQQGLDQVAQHCGAQRDLHSPSLLSVLLTVSLTLLILKVWLCLPLNLLFLLTRC